MAQVYALSRSGGPKSERFAAYVARVEHEFGLVGYNPMAGPPAAAAVEALMALDAESLMAAAARDVAAKCAFRDAITLAIVVASPGMWTDRLATEVQLRTLGMRKPAHGLVYLWTGDLHDERSIRRESAAEAVRVIWTSIHGSASTVRDVLAREGLAYALAGTPYGSSSGEDAAAVTDAVSVLADSTSISDITAVLYGDPACAAHGWPELGIAEHAGYQSAIARAEEGIKALGAPAAVRLPP